MMLKWLFTPRLNLFDCIANSILLALSLLQKIGWTEFLLMMICGIVISSVLQKKATS